jgi:hypothetical protein
MDMTLPLPSKDDDSHADTYAVTQPLPAIGTSSPPNPSRQETAAKDPSRSLQFPWYATPFPLAPFLNRTLAAAPMDRNAPVVVVADAVDAARAAAVAAAEARCAALVAEKEARAAVQSASNAADKVKLVVEAVKYRSFVEDNSKVTDFVSLFVCRIFNMVQGCCSF